MANTLSSAPYRVFSRLAGPVALALVLSLAMATGVAAEPLGTVAPTVTAGTVLTNLQAVTIHP